MIFVLNSDYRLTLFFRSVLNKSKLKFFFIPWDTQRSVNIFSLVKFWFFEIFFDIWPLFNPDISVV